MATRVFDAIKFCAQFLKRTSQGKFLPSLVQIGPAVREEKMLKENVDDAQRTHHHPKLPLSMLCSGELKKKKSVHLEPVSKLISKNVFSAC